MRARQPDHDGFAERDGVKLVLRGVRRRAAPRPCCSCRRGRSSRRGSGRPRCPTWRGTSASSPSTDGAAASPTGPSGPPPTSTREFAADAVAVLDATEHRAGHPRRRCRAAPPTACTSPPTTPTGSPASFAIGPSCGFGIAHAEREQSPLGRPSSTRPRAGPSTTGATGSRATTTTSCGSSSGRCSRSRTRRSRSRTASGGATRSHRETLVDTTAGRLGHGGAVCQPLEALCERVRCPVTVVHGDRRPHQPARERRRAWPSCTGGSLVTIEGGRPRTAGPRPGARQPAHQGLRRAASSPPRPPSIHVDPSPAAARSGRCTCRRPSDSATPGATSPSPRSSAGTTPTCEIDWLAQHPVTPVLEAAGRAGAPGVGLAGQRVGPHRGRVRRARPARLPGDPATWTRSS